MWQNYILRRELSGDARILRPAIADPRGAVPRRANSSRLRGFVLLEVMVALTLLALVLTPLAAMVFKISSRSHRIVGSSYRNAVLLDEVNYLESLPYDSLATGTTTTSVTVRPYPHTTTVAISEVWTGLQGKMKKVKIVITPTNTLYRPDTASFMRTVVFKSSLFTEDDQ